MENILEKKMTFAFRKVYRNWFKELSDTFPTNKRDIVRYYKAHMDDENEILTRFRTNVAKENIMELLSNKSMDFFQNCNEFYSDIKYSELIQSEPGQNETFRQSQLKYLVQLCYLHLILTEGPTSSSSSETILSGPSPILMRFMEQMATPDMSEFLKEIIGEVPPVSEEQAQRAEEMASDFFQKNPFLTEIAESLSKDVQIPEEFKSIQNPTDILGLIMNPSGQRFMEDMVKRVGEKINTKIEQGEISPEDLAQQAQSMMSGLFGQNPLFQGMMGGMMGSSSTERQREQDDEARKEELRKKIREKVKENRDKRRK